MKLNKNFALSESGFAFNGSTGDTFILNETGFFIIQKIKDNLPQEDILKSLLEKYEVSATTVEKDLLEFINQLKSFQLLED